MSAEAKAKALGIEFTDDAEKAYLNVRLTEILL